MENNEAARSTSEEQETSKEELQSIDEELQAVNSELRLKLETVSRAHSDLRNLIAATDFGALFLDRELRIKRFTQRVADLFSITGSDEGRPIADFTHQLEHEGFAEDARAVLRNLAPIEREVRSRAGRWHLMRLRPYRTAEDKIDGVIVTFVDVTERRRTEEALRESQERLQQEMRLVELSRSPIFVWDFDDGIVKWNRGSEQLYGYSREEAVGLRKEKLLKSAVPGSSLAEVRQELLRSGGWSGEIQQVTKDGRALWVESQIELVNIGGRRLCLESTRDVTERKSFDMRQKLLLGELTHRVKNTLAVALSIARQTFRGGVSPEQFLEAFEGRVKALANAHQLLAQSDWAGADLEKLTRQQLSAFLGERGERVRIAGSAAIILPPDLATPFAMVLHELATNAAKYGALSAPKGTIDLRWRVYAKKNGRKILNFTWKEVGGPAVMQPASEGFGSSLIENSLPGATVRREFDPKGLACKIELPIAESDEGRG